MSRLDAAVLMTQLNIRQLLEARGLPDINIIQERLSYVGTTRFEDQARLPLGISVNSASFAAKALTQVPRGEGAATAPLRAHLPARTQREGTPGNQAPPLPPSLPPSLHRWRTSRASPPRTCSWGWRPT